MSLGKQSAPATPDYAGAAQATAAGNLEAAKYATVANRANQYTPYGNMTWQRGATDYDPWTQNVNLNSTGQSLLDASNRSSLGLANLQDNATSRVADSQAKPFDYSSVQDTQDAAYKNFTSRLDPQWQHNSEQQAAQLANQGITQGSAAYDDAMRTFNQGKNDAYTQANQAAINTAPQTLAMAQSLRNQPLNELNALRTGSQVTNPTFSTYNQQATTGGADMSGAVNSQYNAQLGATNANNAGIMNFTNGLFGMGSAAAGNPKFSDIRLKKNIVHVGVKNGLNVYEYDYIWGGARQLGVMAQEVLKVKPSAVMQHPSGFLMVDYGAI